MVGKRITGEVRKTGRRRFINEAFRRGMFPLPPMAVTKKDSKS